MRVGVVQRNLMAQGEACFALIWRDQRLFELDLIKKHALIEQDEEKLKRAARSDFLIQVANAKELLRLCRQEVIDNRAGYLQTLSAATTETSILIQLEELVARYDESRP